MKKIVALLLAVLVVIMVLGFVACGKKTTEYLPVEEVPQDAQEVVIEGDPMEYSMEYWAEKFPGENICPFYIDENGVEKPYYLIMSMGTAMSSWIESPFNWNGWHKVGEDIVNQDETLKMTADWATEDNFSSFCTVTTEPYNP